MNNSIDKWLNNIFSEYKKHKTKFINNSNLDEMKFKEVENIIENKMNFYNTTIRKMMFE